MVNQKQFTQSLDGQSFLRAAADFAIVQISALAALMLALLLRVQAESAISADAVEEMLRTYYVSVFLPLSLVFPIVYSLSGFYTYSRFYAPAQKWKAIVQGTIHATLIYLGISFLITRSGTLPRSAILAFAVMVAVGTVGTRWLKDRLKSEPAANPDSTCLASESPVLVVGGAGYIGSILVRKLLAAGRKVRVLDSLVYGAEAIRDVLDHPNLELMVGDCRNIQSVVSAVKGVDSIAHLAAIVGDPACEQDRQIALEINYAATRMLIEIARGAGVRRLVFASSCSVYGAADTIMNERSEAQPISLYGQTKVDSERALLDAVSETFHPTILRFATVFGNSHRPRFDLVVNLLTAKAHQEGVITIFNGEQWRPFIHVDDVAQAVVEVLNAPEALVSGQIFNVGDSRLNYTLGQVADKIREQFPAVRVEHVENSDRRNYRVSFDKIRNQLGFQSRVFLEEGIEELKSALENGEITNYKEVSYNNQRFLAAAGSPTLSSVVDTQVIAAFARATASPQVLPVAATQNASLRGALN